MAKTIAIVGAGPLVGMAAAQRFGREGFKVALLARNIDKLKDLVTTLEANGIEAGAFEANVLDHKQLTAALEMVNQRYGFIDVLEYSPTPPQNSMRGPLDLDIENEQLHLDMNILAPITAVRAVLPEMRVRKEGSIIITAAASAQHPAAMTASYGVAAGGTLNYVRLLNKALSPEGIYAGMVSIAGLIVRQGEENGPPPPGFPPGVPLVAAQDVADLIWDLHVRRDRVEAYAGDIDTLLANSLLY